MTIKNSFVAGMQYSHESQDVYPTDGAAMRGLRSNQVMLDEDGTLPTDAVRLGQLNGKYITPVPVTSLADLSSLAAMNATTHGRLILVYEVAAGFDNPTLYTWDAEVTAGADPPYVVAGDGGFWVAIAGRNIALDVTHNGNVVVNGSLQAMSAPAGNQDVVRKFDIFGIMLGVIVGDLGAPDLSGLSDVTGNLLLVKNDAGQGTLYLWSTTATVNPPYVVAGSGGGRWVAIAGNYSAMLNLITNFITNQTGAIFNSTQNAGGDFIVHGQNIPNLLHVSAASDQVNINGQLWLPNDSIGGNAMVTGRILAYQLNTVPNGSTIESTLAQYPIPPNFFKTAGGIIALECYGQTSADTDNRVLRVKLDGTLKAEWDLSAISAGTWILRAKFFFKDINTLSILLELDTYTGTTSQRKFGVVEDTAFVIGDVNNILVSGQSSVGSGKITKLMATFHGDRF